MAYPAEALFGAGRDARALQVARDAIEVTRAAEPVPSSCTCTSSWRILVSTQGAASERQASAALDCAQTRLAHARRSGVARGSLSGGAPGDGSGSISTGSTPLRPSGLDVLAKPLQDLAGWRCRVQEYFDGRVELRHEGCLWPLTVFEEERRVSRGDIVATKRLGAVLATIQADQRERDENALASPRIRNRRKERIRKVRELADAPVATP